MAFLQKEKVFSKNWLKNYTYIVIGSFILASGFVLFITPYKIVPGGVYGISIVLHWLLGTPVGMVALAFDIPLTLIGIKVLGPRFGIKTVVGFILTAVFVDVITFFYGTEPLVEGDALLSSIFGGLFLGVGVGLIFKSKATSGGTDIIAMMIGKKTKIPVGQLMILVDSAIVLIGLIVFQDWKIPLYSLIVSFLHYFRKIQRNQGQDSERHGPWWNLPTGRRHVQKRKKDHYFHCSEPKGNDHPTGIYPQY